ncbi:MAG: hypothetical protein IPF55_19875 [Rhodoferax sp.]|nr:hypothetical protein [Rhodoferax sp.]
MAGRKEVPLVGVKVSLFDRDRLSSDDLLGSGLTDSKGRVSFGFTARQYADIEDVKKPSQPLRLVMPDLYVVVHGAAVKR